MPQRLILHKHQPTPPAPPPPPPPANTCFVALSGSDTTGTGTQLAPFRTVSKANTVVLINGFVLLNGGDIFRETGTPLVTGITYGSYGVGRGTLSGANTVGPWLSAGVGTNTFSVALVTQPLMFYNGISRMVRGTSASTLSNNQWFWTAGQLYFRSDAGNPTTLGLAIEVSQRDYCLNQNGKTGIKLDNIALVRSQHTANGAVFFHGPGTFDDFSVRRCLIAGNYSSGGYLLTDSLGGLWDDNDILDNGQHGVWYASSSGSGSENQTISTNRIKQNGWRLGDNFVGGIVGPIRSGEIVDNDLDTNGITGDPSHAHSIYCGHDLAPGGILRIHRNKCRNQPQGYGIKCTQDALIYENDIDSCTGGGLNLGPNAGSNDVTIEAYRNRIRRSATTGGGGIYVDKSAGTGRLSFKGYNNDLWHDSGGASAGEIVIASDLALLDLRNNAVVGMGTGTKVLRIVKQTGSVLIDNNNYFGADASTPIAYNGTSMSMTTWRAQAFGPDQHSITTDPLFVDPANGNFSLGTGSGAINHGAVIAGITDGFLGTAPDIGAIEMA